MFCVGLTFIIKIQFVWKLLHRRCLGEWLRLLSAHLNVWGHLWRQTSEISIFRVDIRRGHLNVRCRFGCIKRFIVIDTYWGAFETAEACPRYHLLLRSVQIFICLYNLRLILLVMLSELQICRLGTLLISYQVRIVMRRYIFSAQVGLLLHYGLLIVEKVAWLYQRLLLFHCRLVLFAAS